MYSVKKIKSKLFAMITVMALFFTNFVPALSNFTELTSYAAAATNVTVTSMANTGGYIKYPNPFGTDGATDIQYIYISGQSLPATCLEFNTTCMTGNSYTKHTNQAYWDKMSDSQKKAVRLIMHYGYYNDKANHHTQAYFDATQLLVWEVTGYQWHNNHAPLRTFVMDENASNAGSSSCSTPLINYYSGSSDTRAKYNEILANIDTHFDHTTGSYINWYSNAEPQRLANANPLQLKWNSSNFRYELTMTRVKSVWDRYKWTDVLRAAGFTVESKQNSGDSTKYDYTIWTRTPIKKSNAIVVDTKANTSTNSTFAVYDNASVSGDNAQGWGGGQTIGIGGNSYLFAAMAFYNEPDKPPEPTPITVQKYAEDETIANMPNYSSIKGSLYFALQAKTGSTWSYVYFTSSGNRYTYSSVGSGNDPYQLKLDDKGEFILANLPYGTYRLYESWRGSPTGLKSAGLQNPPSSYVKEFTVSASSSTTQKVVNKKMLNGSLEIDKHVDMVDKNTPIPESAYTSLTFTIKDKSGQYLVLDTVDATAGTYKYSTTTATEANATKIKLGTSTHKAVVTDMPIDTGYVVEETCGDPRFKAYSDTVTVNIVAETSSDAPFSNYEVYGSIKGVKVDKNDPSKKLVGAVYGLFKEGTTTFNTSTAYKTATSGSDGVFTFDKVPYGNYIIRELTAPKGYKLSTEQKNISITSQGQTVTVEVADPPINIWFSKKSVTGNAELAGAKMQLRTSTGSVIDSWTSGSSAHLVECVAAGSYILHEEAAPNGYVVANDIDFTVSDDGSIDVVEMIDDTA